MEDEKRIRDKRISVKVTTSVYDYLEDIADRRGLSMSALCGNILGEFKVDQERKEKMYRELVASMGDKFVQSVNFEEMIVKTAKELKELGINVLE